MTVSIKAPIAFPTGIVRAAATDPRAIDNGLIGAASPIRQLELAAQHLGAGRKVAAAGCGGGPFAVTSALFTIGFQMAREPYTSLLRVKGFATVRTKTTVMTITARTDSDPVGQTAIIQGTQNALLSGAQRFEILIECGDGDNGDLGYEGVNIDAQITSGPVPQQGWLWSVTLQPLPQHEPFATLIEV